jgi:putative sugar O-methyltransferase
MSSNKRYIVAITARIRIFLYSFFLSFCKSNANIKIIDGSKTSISGSVEISKRIFRSYIAMKIDGSKDSFTPSPMWQNILDTTYKDLADSYKFNDFNKFQKFINNFGHSKKYTGLTYKILIPRFFNFFRNQYIKKNMLDNQFKKWKFFSNNKNIKELNTPKYGNHHGGCIQNSTFVTYTSFKHEIYGSMLANFLHKKKNPIIAEIGGGFGEQAYFLIKKLKKSTYLNFDLPEVLVLSMFYLMNTFPNKKILLYGEKKLSDDCLNKYDLIFMPPSSMYKLNKNSIDLMINQHSMGEMNKKTVKEYIKIIKKTSKYFFHMNHSYYKRKFERKNYNILSHEYNLEKLGFSLIIKYLDFNHFNYDYFQNYNMDIFFHLYKNKKLNSYS